MSEKLGVLGGAFDPIHYGHLILASEAKNQLGLDKVWFVPTCRSPHPYKSIPTSFEDRCEMVRLGIAGQQDFSCSEMESAIDGPSYSVNTLKMLAQQSPKALFFFIIGADNLEQLETWHAPGELTKIATLVVAGRPGYEKSPGSIQYPYVSIDMPQIEISARDIRQRINENLPVRFLLPTSVEAYIREKGLYSRS